MNTAAYQQVMWDYNLPLAEFEAILRGQKAEGSLDQDWAIARVLENLNYYDAIELVPVSLLKSRWEVVKKKLFKDSIKKGYEFLLQRHAVSNTR